MKRRIAYKMMEDGNIRGFRSNRADKAGATEWQITDPRNFAPSVITATPPKIIEYDEDN